MEESMSNDITFFKEFVEDFIHRDENTERSSLSLHENKKTRRLSTNKPIAHTFRLDISSQIFHKRSYEECMEEEKEIQVIKSHNQYKIDLKVLSAPSIQRLPEEFYAMFNEGNVKRLNSLIERYFDPNCTFRLKRPGIDLYSTGLSFVYKKYHALIHAHPDGVVTIHKSSVKRENGDCIVQCNLRFQGTRVFNNYMTRLCHETTGNELEWSLTNHLDKSKHTVEALDRYAQLEKEMLEKNQVPKLFIKISVIFVIDEYTQKVKMYSAQTRLSSFRPVDIQTLQ
jgi:hypothetical protein